MWFIREAAGGIKLLAASRVAGCEEGSFVFVCPGLFVCVHDALRYFRVSENSLFLLSFSELCNLLVKMFLVALL